MANITQTIHSLNAGISQQPDEQKIPGQVRDMNNAIPDITQGLLKRPAGKFVKTLVGSTDTGKWFHYYRDENEQYIGQIFQNGTLRMWDCLTGAEKTVVNAIGNTTYLTHTGDEDIQTLTLNDFTYINNRSITTEMDTTTEPDTNFKKEIFVELKSVAYAKQYSLNVFDDTTTSTVTTATRISVDLIKSSNNYCHTDGSLRDRTQRITDSTRCDTAAGDGRDAYAPNVGTRIFDIDDGITIDIDITDNYDESIKKTNVDIVYISLINSLHYKCLKKAIKSNKHILIEKPACINFEEIKDIRKDIYKNKNIYFKEAILYLNHPLIKNIQEISNNENIGKIIKIKSEYGFNFKKKRFFFFLKKKNRKYFDKLSGGGAIMNFGHYPLSAFKVFNKGFGIIKKISKKNIFGSSNVEEFSDLEIEFSDQVKLTAKVSIIQNLDSYIEILGEKGSIRINNPWIPNQNYVIILNKNNIKKEYNFIEKKSLWQLTLENIEKDLTQFKNAPSTYGTDISSSIEYMELINKWRNI